jgi:FAD:protein FMN transferase
MNPATGCADVQRTFQAMASEITVRIGPAANDPRAAIERVRDVFAAVEHECTRFDPRSDLMRANAAGDAWQRVGGYCFRAIAAALAAHQLTEGKFDPRVLGVLTALGYDRSLPFAAGEVQVPVRAVPRSPGTRWSPEFDAQSQAVRVGPAPIDLGGIGKGLALRWSTEQIAPECPSFLVEAGGDCYVGGEGPSGNGWVVGVEDPNGSPEPVAVLALRDTSCATSSVRLRHWLAGGRQVHHLIDPSTGTPGGSGLLAVTVVHRDPALAEVWSKTLFLAGRADVGAAATARDLAALWIDVDGALTVSGALEGAVMWRR